MSSSWRVWWFSRFDCWRSTSNRSSYLGHQPEVSTVRSCPSSGLCPLCWWPNSPFDSWCTGHFLWGRSWCQSCERCIQLCMNQHAETVTCTAKALLVSCWCSRPRFHSARSNQRPKPMTSRPVSVSQLTASWPASSSGCSYAKVHFSGIGYIKLYSSQKAVAVYLGVQSQVVQSSASRSHVRKLGSRNLGAKARCQVTSPAFLGSGLFEPVAIVHLYRGAWALERDIQLTADRLTNVDQSLRTLQSNLTSPIVILFVTPDLGS